MAANRVALAGVREEERVGQRTLLDVLNAEQELLNSEVTLVTDRRNVVVASYALVSAIGRLNAQELGVAALVYDPEQHYQEVRDKWFDLSITHRDGKQETLAPPRQKGAAAQVRLRRSAAAFGLTPMERWIWLRIFGARRSCYDGGVWDASGRQRRLGR